MLVKTINLQPDNKFVQITWSTSPDAHGAEQDADGAGQDAFPFLWLRYNCQCSECFHPGSISRLNGFATLDLNDAPQKAEISEDGSSINITWKDEHISCYNNQWLWERRFTEDVRLSRDKCLSIPMKYWGSELQGHIPTETYSNLMNSDKSLYKYLVVMEETGLFLIKEAPKENSVLFTFADRIAYLRKTHYGPDWHIRAKIEPSSLAYTAIDLPLHVDLAFVDYTPGIQMLHCLKQVPTEGGDNYFCDGLHVAKQLQKSDPDVFHLLSTVKIDFQDQLDDYIPAYCLTRRPVIQLNNIGEIIKINYDQPKIDSNINLPVDDVDAYFRALKQFDDALNEKDKVVSIKMDAGDILCFDNQRVLHARRAYKATADGERLLHGGYLDWDEVRSRRRLLEN